MEDRDYMLAALELAREAAADGEVPVGCVITRRGEIVGRGRNRREKDKSALAHAEIEAISQACKNLGGWRLWECTLYVTLEPCPMCAGAIVNARIPRVVFGASDEKCGACGSVCDLFSMDFNHHPKVEKGIRDILIISTPTDLPGFRRLLGDGSDYGVNFSYAEQPSPDGLAQAFIIGEEFIGNDAVCMVLGDNIFYGPAFRRKLREAMKNTEGATVFGYYVNDPERFIERFIIKTFKL